MRRYNDETKCLTAKNVLPALIMLFIPFLMHAQNDRSLLRDGNKEYKKRNFPEAETRYRKSIEHNP